MTMRLNKLSYENAQKLIKNRQCVVDDGQRWTEHRPSKRSQKRLIEDHGRAEYRKWHLGEEDEEKEDSRKRYKFPYGDFQKVHLCAVVSAQSEASRQDHWEIEAAAAHLRGMLEQLK
jgi:hypothetical protein